MKALIIDDDLEFADELAMSISKLSNLDIDITNNQTFEYNCDIFFLDIDMPNINGIILAKKIKNINNKSLIIFVSYREDLIFEALQTFPYYFLRKKHLEQELPILLNRLNELNTSSILTINYQNNDIHLSTSNILYLKKDGRYLIIKTTNNSYRTRHSIKKLLPHLPRQSFATINQGFIANFKYIESEDKDKIVMKDNTTAYFSRGKYRDFIIAYIKFIENI